MNLTYISDRILLNDTKKLVEEYRKITLQLLHHLREIEKRKLYADLGYSSLFFYIVQELGFSEGSAARRIKAARLLEEIPEIESKIRSGELTLTNLSKAADAFKQEHVTDLNFKKEVLFTIENTSTRTCEKTLQEITGFRHESKTHLGLYLNEEEYKLYQELKALIPQDDFWKKIFTAAAESIRDKKFKLQSKSDQKESSTRYIPASVKKAVFERDKVCVNCGSIYRLEFDRIRPFSMGGKTKLSNLRLLCRSCNQRARIRQGLKAPSSVKVHGQSSS